MSNLIKVSIDDQIKNYRDDLINECLVNRVLAVSYTHLRAHET